MLTVEHRRQRLRAEENRHAQHGCNPERGADAPAEQPPQLFPVTETRAAADQRLYAGAQSGKDSDSHQSKIGHHAVSRHAGIAAEAQQHQIEQQQHHAGGDFTDERGQTGRAQARHTADAQRRFDEMEAAGRSPQVRQQHQNADKRRKAGRKRRTEHAQSARENENVIEHDVEQAARDHAAHGNGRRTVIARERQQHVVHHEERPEAPQHAQVGHRHAERLRVRAEQTRERFCKAQSAEQEQQSEQQSERRRVREYAVRLSPIVLRPRDRVLRCRAHAEHQADAVHQVVRRYGDVERRQSERTQSLRNEIGIRENVARNADHPQDVHRGIVPEFAQSSLFVQFLLPLKDFYIKSNRPFPEYTEKGRSAMLSTENIAYLRSNYNIPFLHRNVKWLIRSEKHFFCRMLQNSPFRATSVPSKAIRPARSACPALWSPRWTAWIPCP